jgi:hypothetical protein
MCAKAESTTYGKFTKRGARYVKAATSERGAGQAYTAK